MSFFFLDIFTAKKSYVVLLRSFYRPKWQISLPFYILPLAKFLHQKTERRTPFGGCLPSTGSTPPAPRKRLTWSLLMMLLLTIKLGGFPCSNSEDLNKSFPLPSVWSVFNMIREGVKIFDEFVCCTFRCEMWLSRRTEKSNLLNLRPL